MQERERISFEHDMFCNLWSETTDYTRTSQPMKIVLFGELEKSFCQTTHQSREFYHLYQHTRNI